MLNVRSLPAVLAYTSASGAEMSPMGADYVDSGASVCYVLIHSHL